ncbi:MAG: histidine phosphatase family protein [Candidatus Pacearchaeota archaeon]|nr:histidine phosphatase family protein [Candidatus Pacearchaeota archaeon]
MGCKIYLFRHGVTRDNAEGIFSGWRDVSLNEKGRKDACIISLRLKDRKIGLAFHSGMKRSIETLNEILKFHPECNLIVEDPRIKERNYGKLQGKSHLEIVQKQGASKYDSWHRSYETKPPGGESIKDVEKRVLAFIKDLLKLVKEKKVNVAISAHGNSIRPIRRYFEKLSIPEMCSLYNDYESVWEYEV